MLALKRLRIKGFRAYTDEKEFMFDNPMILLFGENHLGKSSTLNAIEWCLFGNKECSGEKTGIRERVEWIVPNLRLNSNADVFVELELKDEQNQVYKIFRKWLSTTKDQLKITLPDGTILEDSEAKKKLDSLIKMTFKDFMATVYQHQEAIRAILTQVPKDRNDAIDRLLGLSDYRNIIGGIEDALKDLKSKRDRVDINKFSQNIESKKNFIEDSMKEKKEEALLKGIKEEQIDETAVLELANKEVKEKLHKFAQDANLQMPEILVPDHWKELNLFINSAKEIINNYRSEIPEVKKQKELFDNRLLISNLQASYEEADKTLKDYKKQLNEFIEKNGDKTTINNNISKIKEQIEAKNKELEETNAKAAIINNAIGYLRLEDINKNICPVCGKETPDLLEHLEEEWEKVYQDKVGDIEKEINNLKAELKNNKALMEEYEKIEQKVNTYENLKIEEAKKIGKFLQREISKDDDPVALLNEIAISIETKLNELKLSLDNKQDILNNINFALDKINLIVELLKSKEKRESVDVIEESPEFKQIQLLNKKTDKLIENLNSINNLLIKVSREEAESKISAAEAAIDDYFRRIANNPLIKHIKFSVGDSSNTSSNYYEFKGQNNENLIPILSQGDLNALALSIFLGLTCSEGINQPFNFIILDDPSQSLSSNHKENFVDVLNNVLENRVVILSSMDKELQNLLSTKITKAKTKYSFTNWTPESGPEVEKE